MPYAFKQISTGHVQLRYPVCPDFEKAIYGVTIPGTAIFSFELYVDDDDSAALADSDSSDGNISGDDSCSSMEQMPFWGADDESNDGSSACGGSAGSVSHAFRCPCGLSHCIIFLTFMALLGLRAIDWKRDGCLNRPRFAHAYQWWRYDVCSDAGKSFERCWSYLCYFTVY